MTSVAVIQLLFILKTFMKVQCSETGYIEPKLCKQAIARSFENVLKQEVGHKSTHYLCFLTCRRYSQKIKYCYNNNDMSHVEIFVFLYFSIFNWFRCTTVLFACNFS